MESLHYTKYFCPQALQIIITAQFLGKQLELNLIDKKYSPVSLVTKKGVLNKPNAILRYLASGTVLNGTDSKQSNQINQWFQWLNMQLDPILNEVFKQIFGQKELEQQKYVYSIDQITKNLKMLDEWLKLKTFFIGNTITIVDISFACHLENVFKLLVTQTDRKKLPNLLRWYNFIRETPAFTKVYGKIILCGKNAFKVQFPKPQEKKQQKIEKDEGSFSLDSFKRDFQNTDNQLKVVNDLLDNFDGQHWSIWKIHYQKDVTEGKVQFLTQNMANGSFQRFQRLRKTGFGNWGVYCSTENQFQIRGLLMWKGTDIASEWKQHPSYEYHKFFKLDPKLESDRNTILDYWMERETAEGLALSWTKRLV